MLLAKSNPTKVLKSFFPFFGTPVVNGPIYLFSNYEPPPIFLFTTLTPNTNYVWKFQTHFALGS
jgi:hypothetical protein